MPTPLHKRSLKSLQGKLERALYPAAGLAKFQAMADAGTLERVYSEGSTQIFRVPRGKDALAVLSTTLDTRAPTYPAPRSTQLAQPVYTLKAVPEYSWSALGQSQPVAIVLWLLAIYALLALGLPVAAILFGGLATRGAGAADP
ncbi:hypothetical protein SE17_01905 [Kouleothrix aurantiaca]|uniref:Uncharacterized protein n=1 Tax=Kouleothrix aurantiaca TaxID=186479 RepID=A0A0P9HIN9_9CHLR|nr:hypothetical protein SE17_01905 [Kouleothrix aurantiaca]